MTTLRPGTRVVGYFRVSSDAQDVANSIQTQSRRFYEFVKQHQLEAVGIFKDEAKTGMVDDRPGFLDMVSASRQKPKLFDAVVVVNTARFARNRLDAVVYKHIIRKNGVAIVSIDQPNDGSPEGELMEGMFEVLDAYYSANLSRAIRHGIENLIRAGYYPIARAPYGYTKVPVQDGADTRYKLAINEQQAANVRLLFDLYEDGNHEPQLPGILNQRGIPSPSGGKWPANTIHDMLRRQTYKGTVVFPLDPEPGREQIRVDNIHPAIISPEQFDMVQQILTANRPGEIHPKQVSSRYLLSKLAVCNLCGASMVITNSKNGQYVSYICHLRKTNGPEACFCNRRPAEDLDTRFLNQVCDDILTPQNVDKFIENVDGQTDHQLSKYQDTMAAIDAELRDLEERFTRLSIMNETGKMPLDIWSQRADVLNEQRQLLNDAKTNAAAAVSDDLRLLENRDTALAVSAELRRFLAESPPANIKPILRKFIKQVRCDTDRVIIDYKIPLPDDSANARESSTLLALSGPVRTITPLAPPSLLNSPYGVGHTSTSSL